MNFILQTPNGFVIASKSANFPKLADLEHFIDLRPAGLAPSVAGKLDAVRVVGRAA